MAKSKTAPFRPVSKKTRLKMDNKPKTPTIFIYQKGYINDKIALRFYKKENKQEKVFKTLVALKEGSWKTKDDLSIWDIIRDLGGQDPERAQKQREECLMQIVSSYFRKLGFSIEIEPNLNQNTPDMLVIKGKHSCYIELKAYFSKTIVGEPEVAQLIKYFAIAKSDPELSAKIAINQINPPKFMLIHTGNLIPFQKNSLVNGEIRKIQSEDSRIKFIKKKYRIYLKKLGRPNNMESFDTRNIYYNAWRKVKKYSIDLNYSPNVLQLEEPKSLDKLIEDTNGYDMILIPSEIFSQILSLSKLKYEKMKFELVQKTWLERLIFDRSIISFNSKQNI